MRTSVHQFDLLVTFMERYGDLSKPSPNAKERILAIKKWDELGHVLNSDGSGVTKTIEKWKKVWSDYKNNTKRKAARLQKLFHRTAVKPAGQSSLTDLEKRVLNLIGEQAATSLPSKEAGIPQEILEPSPPPASLSPTLVLPIPPPPPVLDQSQIKTYSQPWNEAGLLPQAHVDPPQMIYIQQDINPSLLQQYTIPLLQGTFTQRASDQRTSDQRASAHPSVSGQTTPPTLRRSGLPRPKTKPRRQVKPTQQAIHHFLRSDKEWRNFNMHLHQASNEMKKKQNKIRRLELEVQRGWQLLGTRALDILERYLNL